MSMAQLVIGTTLGFMIAQGVLYAIGRLVGWLRREDVRVGFRTVARTPGHSLVRGFIRYAAPVGAGAALIALGAWAVKDDLGAKTTRSAPLANAFDPSAALSLSDSQGSVDATATPAPAERTEAAAAGKVDPYADPDFRVPRRPHRAGTAVSLKETLVQRSEAKARADLTRDTQQQRNRSQYDCEAADRADKYLKAGLDVWGFAAWQVKYFPMDGYEGATLAQCQDIKEVIDPSRFDLRSTVARENHS
jgi:hypothetical protein